MDPVDRMVFAQISSSCSARTLCGYDSGDQIRLLLERQRDLVRLTIDHALVVLITERKATYIADGN